jgi:hypothetical protein
VVIHEGRVKTIENLKITEPRSVIPRLLGFGCDCVFRRTLIAIILLLFYSLLEVLLSSIV